MATTISGNGVDKVLDTVDLSTNDSIEALESKALTALVVTDSSQTILKGINATSLVKQSTGVYRLTYATAINNANVTVSGTALATGNAYPTVTKTGTSTTTYVDIHFYRSNVLNDIDEATLVVHGGKA